jgi:hypothetical protein
LSPSLRRADSKEEAMLDNDRNQFLNQKNQQNERNGSQEQIVELKQGFELESWQLFHKQLSAENNHEISNTSNEN